ncbi:MAG: glycosyltransferase family 39 protein [Bacteroidetes bacterium]|nr:glycosyltransferase family 39 protein [Bacteroidota bacterium]
MKNTRKNTTKQIKKDAPFFSGTGIRVLILLAFTALTYWGSLSNDFTNWDDDLYVTENADIQSLSASTIQNFFTSFKNGNYHPLTWLSLAFDYNLSKLSPFQYHLTNLLLHLFNTLLCFVLIKKLFNSNMAWLASLLFGVHSIHVESVAWVSERKDVLFTFFYLLSVLSYIEYCVNEHKKYFVISLLCFVFSALSKGQAVSLAITIVLIDILLNRKLNSIKVIAEKSIFVLLALVFGLIAIKAQSSASAIFDNAARNFFDRILFACYGFINYLLKFIYPFKLSAIYPYPTKGAIGIEFWACFVLSLGYCWLLFKSFKSNRQLFFCLAFYVVNIFLVLQLIPVGNAIMADRYSYIPSLGIFTVFAFYINKYIEQEKTKKLVALGVVVYLLLLAYQTTVQIKVWKNSFTLWEHTTRCYPTAEVAWNNLGSAHNNSNNYNDAITCYTNAINVNKLYADAYSNRGMSKKNAGNYKEAILDLDQAIKLKPINPFAYSTKGTAYIYLNELELANTCFVKALAWDPYSAEALSGLGAVKTKKGDIKGALADLNKSISLRPNHAETISNRGIAKAEGNDLPGAIQDFNLSIQLKPKSPGAYVNRGMVYLKMNQPQYACADFYTALNLGASSVEPFINKYCNLNKK